MSGEQPKIKFSAEPLEITPVIESQSIGSIIRSVHLGAQTSPDLTQRALYTRLGDDIEQFPKTWQDIFTEYLENNPNDTSPTTLRKLLSSFQEMVMPPINSTVIQSRPSPVRSTKYPDGFQIPSRWDPAFKLFHNDPLQQAYFRLNFIEKQLQSNVLTRYAASVVAKKLFGLRTVNIYSGGPSFGILEKMHRRNVARRHDLPPYVVGSKIPADGEELEVDQALTAGFNDLLKSPLDVKRIIGVDLDPPQDPLTSSYAYSNSFRPNELHDRRYRAAVRTVLSTQVPGMTIIAGDFSSPDHVERFRDAFPEWFSLSDRWAQLITTEYQSTPEQREQTDRNMQIIAGENGYIERLDFVHRDAHGQFIYPVTGHDYRPYSYRQYVTPMADPEKRPRHVMSYRTGRATEAVPGTDFQGMYFGAMQTS